MQIRVYYEDTDTGGVVHHSNYLNFCERARSDVFFQKGLSPVLRDGHFVARKLEVNYFSSAKLGDELEIKTILLDMRGASFELMQEIYKDNIKIFDMRITLAYIGFNSKLKKIDKDAKELICSLFDQVS